MYKKITANIMVADVGRTVDFYERVLDFGLVMAVPEDSQRIVTTREAGAPLAFAIVRQGNAELMFQSRRSLATEPPAPVGHEVVGDISLYIEVDNVKDLYRRLRDKVTIHQDLHSTFYGMEEFYIRDCNGYVLGFASRQEARV